MNRNCQTNRWTTNRSLNPITASRCLSIGPTPNGSGSGSSSLGANPLKRLLNRAPSTPNLIPMENTYIIAWKSKAESLRSGQGKKLYTRQEAQELAGQMNRDYPGFIHE